VLKQKHRDRKSKRNATLKPRFRRFPHNSPV
jgi:hypothetical protein